MSDVPPMYSIGVQSPEKGRRDEVVTYRAKSSGGLARGAGARRGSGVGRLGSMDAESHNHQPSTTEADQNSSLESLGGSNQSTPTHSHLLGSTKGLRSSDRTADRKRSSGLGNITHSSTLPASMRPRSQSMSGASGSRYSRGGTKSTLPTEKDTRQLSSHMKSMGLGPRVPLATSLSDSPRKGSTATSRTAHFASSDFSPEPSASLTMHGVSDRTASPIQLEPTLVEEEEEGEGEEGGEGSARGRTVPDRSPQRRQEKVVNSRVPIETESSAFKVDARELQVVLEATPRQSKSIVAKPQVKQTRSVSLPSSPSSSPARRRKLPSVPGADSTSDGNASKESLPMNQESRKPVEVQQTLTPASQRGDGRTQSTSPIATNRGSQGGDPYLTERSVSTMALTGGSGGVEEQMTSPRTSNATSLKHTVSLKEKPTQGIISVSMLLYVHICILSVMQTVCISRLASFIAIPNILK